MNGLSKALCRGVVAVIVAVILTTGFARPADACSSSDVYLGTICVFPFNFCPQGWAPAQGQLLTIGQNQALFSLFLTTYGGDGTTTFALPDLRSRMIRGTGQGTGLSSVNLGEKAGAESAAMTVESMPAHNHGLLVTNVVGDSPGPNGKILSRVNPDNGTIKPYNFAQAAAPNFALAPSSISMTGGGQPFALQPPTLGTTICVAVQGIFPPP